MAEETVVKEILTKEMIEAGDRLTRLLDEAELEVSASLWLYLPESNIWRLIIASPEASKHGPKKVYERIHPLLYGMPEGQRTLALRDISVVEDSSPIVSLLRAAIRTGDGVSGIRFSRNAINGHFIEDAYIYRIR